MHRRVSGSTGNLTVLVTQLRVLFVLNIACLSN